MREHGLVAGVAAAYVCVALINGGYGAQFRAVMGLLAWWAVLAVLISGARPSTTIPKVALIASLSFAGLAVFTALSMVWAADQGGAFQEAIRTSSYLGIFVLIVLTSRPGSAGLWLRGLGIGLVVVAAVALASRYQPSWFPDQDIRSFLPGSRTRLSYPVNYWNGLGACMAAAIVLAAWHAIVAAGRVERALWNVGIPLAALALFLTSSRGGVAALAVGALALFALVPDRIRALAWVSPGALGSAVLVGVASRYDVFLDGGQSATAESEGHEVLLVTLIVAAGVGGASYVLHPLLKRLRVGRALKVGTALATAVVALAGAIAVDPVDRIDELSDPPSKETRQRDETGFVVSHLTSSEGTGRYQLWESAWDAFESEPVRGIGAGGYESWWTQFGAIELPTRDAHSLYLETLAEVGLLGGFFLLGLIASAIVAGLLRRSSDTGATGALALLLCAATSAAIDWTWELPAAFLPAVVAAAVLVGPATTGWSRSLKGTRLWGAALGAAGLVALGATALGLAGELQLGDSRAAARAGDLPRAEEDARAATTLLPWSAAAWLQVALTEEGRNPAAALGAMEKALDRSPEDWELWVVATRLRLVAGDVEGARRALERARALNPRSSLLAQDPG